MFLFIGNLSMVFLQGEECRQARSHKLVFILYIMCLLVLCNDKSEVFVERKNSFNKSKIVSSNCTKIK